MAGSYLHVVEEDGRLSSNETVAGMLENGGDVYEAVEEMYGMIWWLATSHDPGLTPEQKVEQARLRYTEGLAFSPGLVEED
jgi:hypothetical protein